MVVNADLVGIMKLIRKIIESVSPLRLEVMNLKKEFQKIQQLPTENLTQGRFREQLGYLVDLVNINHPRQSIQPFDDLELIEEFLPVQSE
jgi:hypothetical protein